MIVFKLMMARKNEATTIVQKLVLYEAQPAEIVKPVLGPLQLEY